MVVDFSQTINRFTQQDAYPLPNIGELVNKIGKNSYFSVVDLSSAYYQVEIDPGERIYTAFEAAGQLYHFKRIPMGVTNGAAAFQRVMNDVVSKYNLKETYAYLDDVTICGQSKREHDENLKRFWEVAAEVGLTINKEKCKLHQTSVNVLGHSIFQWDSATRSRTSTSSPGPPGPSRREVSATARGPLRLLRQVDPCIL